MPKQRKSEKLKLDQIMKVLFKLSRKSVVNLMNGLFNEGFDPEKVIVEHLNSEFIDHRMGRIIGDVVLKIMAGDREYTYHIEFQTTKDKSMVIRMFRYGFGVAIDNLDGDGSISRIEFPKQLVIYLEEVEGLGDELAMEIVLPDGNVVKYGVPVLKNWILTPGELEKKKMYALLPLQVFKSRKSIEAICSSKKAKAEKARLVNNEFEKLRQTLLEINTVLKKLAEDAIRDDNLCRDLGMILAILNNICEYLYNKYGEYNEIKREVLESMVTTYYNPKLIEMGKKEGVKKGIEEGIREGIREGKIQDIIELLQDIGGIKNDLRVRIQNEYNIAILSKWLKLAARAETIDEFETGMDKQ